MSENVINDAEVAVRETQQPNQQMEAKLEINTSRNFCHWMSDNNLSLAFTTYQAGKIFFVGLKSDKEGCLNCTCLS